MSELATAPHMVSPITEDWLKAAGFKWHQFDLQPDKHWLLWLGDALKESSRLTSFSDIGLELAPAWWKNRNDEDIGNVGAWHCWFRADVAGRYHRFIHIRHLKSTGDLILLIEAITGQLWNPQNNLYGSMRTPEDAKRIREENNRLDRRMMFERGEWAKWSDVEKDDTRGRALPEHLEAHAKANETTLTKDR